MAGVTMWNDAKNVHPDNDKRVLCVVDVFLGGRIGADGLPLKNRALFLGFYMGGEWFVAELHKEESLPPEYEVIFWMDLPPCPE